MTRNSPLYHDTDQTTPDIYAGHRAFSPGRADEGRYQQWSICYTIHGPCRWRVENEEFVVATGDVHVTRPHSRLHWRVDGATPGYKDTKPSNHEGWELYYAVFNPRPHWLPWLNALEYRGGAALIHTGGEMRLLLHNAFLNLEQSYDKGGLLRDEHALLELENVLLILHAYTVLQHKLANKHVMAAVDVIHAKYAEPVSVPDVARCVCLSVQHLSALFREEMGVAPGQYIERVRMDHAAEMLRFGMPSVGEVARATGYTDVAYFSRRFRHHFGAGPRDYRAANRVHDRVGGLE